MKIHVLLVGILVGLSFTGGWYASSSFQKSIQAPTRPQESKVKPITTSPGDVTTERADFYSGNGMSPGTLYASLNNLSGVDFDMRYINYVILMQANLSGINRLAKEKAVAPSLKDKATELWELDSRRMNDLYTLQKALGYSHH